MHVTMMHDYAVPAQYPGFGFSLKKVVKNVGKAVGKGVKDVGHAAGAAATSTIGKAVIGSALALTGVGIPAAAGLMAASQAGGNLIKKGGNLKRAAKGAAEGAVEGAAAGVAGKFLPKIPGVGSKVLKLRNKLGMTKSPASNEVVSYDSDSRIDALAAGKLPTVTTTPTLSTQQSALTPSIPSLAKRVTKTIAKTAPLTKSILPTSIVESPERQAKTKESVIDRLAAQAKKVAKSKAIDMATSVLTPPSANPSAPQGGFPAMPETLSPSNQNQDSEVAAPAKAGMGEMFSNPAVLIGIAAIAFLAMQRRR